MSEYQYYEFQAVDKPLSNKDREALRDLSTRAQISSTSFINEYNWGDFKGNPLKLMEKYFDAFLYVANWGTHWLMFRIPKKLINLDLAKQYCMGESAIIHEKGDYLIFEFTSETEDGEWEEGEGYLSSLISLRSDLIHGDYRCLYLAWIYGIQMDEFEEDEEEFEPPVPPGLKNLNASLESFVDFMRIDSDLIAVAATNSASKHKTVADDQKLKSWIKNLPSNEKDEIIFRLINENDPHLGNELQQQFQNALSNKSPQKTETNEPRSIIDLLKKAEAFAKERQRRIAKQNAKEKARREREAAIAREKYLNDLDRQQDDIWKRIDSLILTKKPKDYDEAVKLLVDLRDLGKKNKTTGEFKARLLEIRNKHNRKPSLMSRIDFAGL
jgi:FtsZ-interacting cell division protein YlmF